MGIETFDFIARGSDDERDLSVEQTRKLPRWNRSSDLAVVGTPVDRKDAWQKVGGTARYIADLQLPGLLHAAVLRSPHAHARVRRVDADRARTIPGVHAVLHGPIEGPGGQPLTWYEEDAPIFSPVVRFVGDEVAVVAASSPETLVDALAAIEVDYEPLPVAADLEAARAPGAVAIHREGNRVAEPTVYVRGDVDQALARADLVIEGTWTTPAALHQALETHATLAHFRGGELLLHESTQGIYAVRDRVADALGLPRARVRVVSEFMGGGFGAKQVAWKQTLLAAVLARHTGRPVRLELDRRGECLAAGARNATRQRLRLGATAQGRLLAIDLEAEMDGGAYTIGGESSAVDGLAQHLYSCANVRTSQVRIHTNTGPAVAFRAPGYVEGCVALESAMDELARRTGIDPFALRRLNAASHDQVLQKPWSSPQALERCMVRAAQSFGWNTWSRPPADGSWRRGIGMAVHDWQGGKGKPPAYAWVMLNGDASVEVVTGTQDIGTGTRTVLAQTAAEVLGLEVDDAIVRLGDTGTGPYAPTSSGSYTVPTMVPAVRAAALDAREQLFAAAARLMDVDVARLVLRRRRIAVREEPDRSVELTELLGRLDPHMIQGHGARHANDDRVSIRPFGAQCVEVAVDTATGEIRVLRVTSAPDCGRIVNPKLADSQVIGGVTQGIGFALSEGRTVDTAHGWTLNANLEDYLVPTIMDTPAIEHARVDLPDLAANPAGVKGLGELPMIPTAPAILNAIHDAVGIRLRSLPVTRSQVLAALHAAANCGARDGAAR